MILLLLLMIWKSFFPAHSTLSDLKTFDCNCTTTEKKVFRTMDNFCTFLNTEGPDTCCWRVKIEEVAGPFSLNCSQDSGRNRPLRKIRGLDLVKADVRSLDMENVANMFPRLTELDLSGNSNLPLEALANVSGNLLGRITNLSLSGINIGKFDSLIKVMQKMPRLELLDVSSGNLDYFNFSQIASTNPKLGKINLAGNPIINITLEKEILRQLSHVNLSRCGLETILWEGVRTLPDANLRVVDLSSNNLTNLPEFFIRAVKGVQFLDLRGNHLDVTTCSSYYLWELYFTRERQIKADFEKLSMPVLDLCPWSQCPFQCQCYPETRTVDCTNKDLVEVPTIGPSEARTLLLPSNKISSNGARPLFIARPWCRLEHINLDDNNITQLVDDSEHLSGACSFPRLSSLSLANNKMAVFSHNDWSMIRMATRVNLSRNKLNENSFEGTENGPKYFTLVKLLDLSSNKLSKWTEEMTVLFPFVEEIDLSRNSLNEFDFGLSSLVPRLKVLNLNSNELVHLKAPKSDGDPFSGFPLSVEDLDLGQNRLTVLKPGLFETLHRVALSGNPWNCSEENSLNMQIFMLDNLTPDVAASFSTLTCPDGSPVINTRVIQNVISRQEFPTPHREEGISSERKIVVLVICAVMLVGGFICFATPIKRQIQFRWKNLFDNKAPDGFNREKDAIFAYYSSRDQQEFNERVLHKLQEAGYVVIHPGDFIFGGENIEQVLTAMEESRKMVVFVSQHFLEDERSIYALKMGIFKEQRSKGSFEVAAVRLEHVQTPPNLPILIRKFLELRSLRMGIYDVWWFNNLRRFLGPPPTERFTSDQQVDEEPPSGHSSEQGAEAEDDDGYVSVRL